MRFEWDKRKELANIKKHGISFTEAARIFQLPVLTYFDTRCDADEDRFVAIGWLDQRLIAVVFVERGNELVRLISARRVTRSEARKYERGY